VHFSGKSPAMPYFYNGPQGTYCKQRRQAANKKDTLQAKRARWKQKRRTANKKETLQIKKERCKQRKRFK